MLAASSFQTGEIAGSNDLVRNALGKFVWSESYNNLIFLNSRGEEVYSNGFSEFRTGYFAGILDKLKRTGQNHCWTSGRTYQGGKAVCFTKKVFSTEERGTVIGYINFVFDEKRLFQNVYRNLDFGGESQTFIIGNEREYLSCQYDKEKQTVLLSVDNPQMEEKLVNRGIGNFEASYNKRPCLMVYDYNEDTGWYFVTAIDQEYINRDIQQMRWNITALCAVMIVVGVAVILLICSTIILPINHLVKYTSKIAAGDYQAEIETVSRDEMDTLIENNKAMVYKLVSLMEEIKENAVKQRQMELRVLQSQINPHFIFNTLDTFKNIALLNEMYSISDGINAFSGLLRQTIVKGDEMIPLREELENVKRYLCIQEYKYIGCFVSDFYLEPGLQEFQVPRLLLQPIVENSIMHGMTEGKLLHIKVQIAREQGFAAIRIADDGQGFSEEEAAVRKKVTFSGIGLENIKERLFLVYGPQAQFTIQTQKGKGTAVLIRLPLEGEEKNVPRLTGG